MRIGRIVGPLLLLGWIAHATAQESGQVGLPGELRVAESPPELKPLGTIPAPQHAHAPAPDHVLGGPRVAGAASAAAPRVQLVNAEAPVAAETSEAVLEQKQEEVASQLRVAMLQEQVKKTAAPESNSAPQAETSNVDLLKQIEVTIAQQKSARAGFEDIQAKQNDLKSQLGKLADNRLDEPPPYSILLVDEIRDSLESSKAKQQAMEASLLSAREVVERARVAVETRQKAFRQIKEKASGEDDPKLKAAELEVRLAEESLVLRRQELAIEEVSDSVCKLQAEIDGKKFSIVSQQVQFAKETLDEQIAEIDSRESELRRKVALLQSELQYAERRWLSARQETDSVANPTPELLERVDALKAAQQTIQLEQSVLNQRLQRLPTIRTAWERRYLVASGRVTRDERRVWLEECDQQLDLLQRERRSRRFKIDEARVTLASINAKIEAANGSNAEVKRWLESKSRSLAKQVEIFNSSVLATDSATRIHERLKAQISGEPVRTPLEWIADSWASLQRGWNYELASVDDTSLSVGKVLSTILFLFFGYFAAKWLSQLLGRRLPKVGVDEAGAHAIQSLSFYTFLVAFCLAALRYAHVPLTAFTFLGGAIAIGVGFGSQNILNNFISGLILLAERPIKVGDLILIDEVHGNVTQIGARSTQIRTGENLDIIVPNSKFLENNVINLTRRDDRLRTSINVGVAYGSPLELVMKLLEQAATEHPLVHSRPKPFVWFNDFGDNALAFQVHFWINARSVAQMKKYETEVRLTIDRLFREHEIVIAFPQRDLHIQTTRPLQLQLVKEDDEEDDRFRAAG